MPTEEVIYSTSPVDFNKRVWLNFRRDWFLFFYLTTVAIGIREFNWLGIILTILITVFYVSIILYDAFEKAHLQIIEIAVTDTDFLLTVLQRNKLKGFSVSIRAMRPRLERVSGGKRFLSYFKLSLFNYDNHFLSQYSNGTKKSKDELYKIIHQIESIAY
ncbi:hypothetical protein [Mucilaginibacter terrae]|nr:hypothetical protein [Mucilaginibacter terrae]